MKPCFDRTRSLLFILPPLFACFPAPLMAAPAKPAHTLSPQGRRVVEKVRGLLNSKVSSPGGRMQLRLVPGTHPERGEFREIAASGAPAKVRKLEISQMTLRARDVRIDVPSLFRENKLRTLRTKTSLRAVVSDDDLTRYLAKGKHTQGMGLQVRFQGKATRVTGNFKWQWFSGPVDGLGRLRLGPNYKVYFDIITLKLNGKSVPDWLKQKFSDKINPLIDYDDVPFRPQFKSLEFRGNHAILTA
jgi:hypothetical protein